MGIKLGDLPSNTVIAITLLKNSFENAKSLKEVREIQKVANDYAKNLSGSTLENFNKYINQNFDNAIANQNAKLAGEIRSIYKEMKTADDIKKFSEAYSKASILLKKIEESLPELYEKFQNKFGKLAENKNRELNKPEGNDPSLVDLLKQEEHNKVNAQSDRKSVEPESSKKPPLKKRGHSDAVEKFPNVVANKQIRYLVKEIYSTEKTFREAMKRFHEILKASSNMKNENSEYILSESERKYLDEFSQNFNLLINNPLIDPSKMDQKNLAAAMLGNVKDVFTNDNTVDAIRGPIQNAVLNQNSVDGFFNQMLGLNPEWAKSVAVQLNPNLVILDKNDRSKDLKVSDISDDMAYKAFTSFTVMPVQRLPRIETMLGEIYKQSANTSNKSDFAFADIAQKKVKDSIFLVNKSCEENNIKQPNNNLILLLREVLRALVDIKSDKLSERSAISSAIDRIRGMSYVCHGTEMEKKAVNPQFIIGDEQKVMTDILASIQGLSKKDKMNIETIIKNSTFCAQSSQVQNKGPDAKGVFAKAKKDAEKKPVKAPIEVNSSEGDEKVKSQRSNENYKKHNLRDAENVEYPLIDITKTVYSPMRAEPQKEAKKEDVESPKPGK